MADDVRTTCERCRRPEATHGAPPIPNCVYGNAASRRECDRLLLERANRDEELLAQTVRDCKALDEKVAALLAERDALAKAGDALVAAIERCERDRAWHEAVDQLQASPSLAAWRSLRSPKGASNGD